MAIDPSISLQVQPPAGLDIQKYINMGLTSQQLANLQAQNAFIQQSTANAQAQNPGIEAQSQQLQLQQQLNVARVKAAQDAMEVDSNGQPVIDPVTGTAKMNTDKYVSNLARAGLPAEGLKYQAEQFANQRAMLDNQAAQQGLSKTNIEMSNSINTTAANLAYGERQRLKDAGASQQQQEAGAMNMYNNVQSQAIKNAPQNKGVIVDPKNLLPWQPGLDMAYNTAQISPEAQKSLKIAQQNADTSRGQLGLAQQQFGQSQLLTFTDPSSQDPNSPTSQRARDIVFNATGQQLPADVSATRINTDPFYKQYLNSAGANAAATQTSVSQDLNKWQQAKEALQNAKNDMANSGVRFDNFIQNWKAGKIQSTPSLMAYYSAISQLPPGSTDNWDSYNTANAVIDRQIISSKNSLRNVMAPGSQQNAVTPGTGVSPTPTPGNPQQLYPQNNQPANNTPALRPPSTPSIVRMRFPNGDIRDVDTSIPGKEARAKALGAQPLSQ
jgi:hypothetical protein